MARIRTIKPDFFASDTVSALPLRARLTWIGLWTHCDDQGRCRDNVKLIKAAVWPLDDLSLREVDEDLLTLAKYGRIVRYSATVDGKSAGLIQIVNWDEHQRINRPSKARFPAPPNEVIESALNSHGGLTEENPVIHKGYPQTAGPQDSPPTHDTLTEGSSQEGKGKERNREGKRAHAHDQDQRPSPRCPRHQNDLDPPNCGRCADARRAAERWDADAPRREAERRAAIRACPYCDGDGWRYEFGRRTVATPYRACDGTPPERP